VKGVENSISGKKKKRECTLIMDMAQTIIVAGSTERHGAF